jgi:mRNA interferase RelE/StbE
MAWAVRLSDDARREFLELPRDIRERVAKRLTILEENPFPAGCKKLTGTNHYRIRIGSHRVVYFIRFEDRIVQVTRIRHRRDAYRNL